MIPSITFAFCAGYFFYLKKWAESLLSQEYNFDSPSPPRPLPHSPVLSIIVAVLWGVLLLGGVFWGFTYNRDPDHLSVRGSNIETFLLVISSTAVAFSYVVVYRLGEMGGVRGMKNTDLFISRRRTKR